MASDVVLGGQHAGLVSVRALDLDRRMSAAAQHGRAPGQRETEHVAEIVPGIGEQRRDIG